MVLGKTPGCPRRPRAVDYRNRGVQRRSSEPLPSPNTHEGNDAVAVDLIDKGEAPGHPGTEAVSDQVRTDATEMISLLKPDAIGRLLGRTGTIESRSSCRMDLQPPPPGGANVQIQLNGVTGDSSVATCVIRDTVLASRATWPPGLLQHQNGWLTRQVRIALTRSLDSGNLFEIVGSFAETGNLASLTPRDRDHYSKRRPKPRTAGKRSKRT